MTTIVERVAGLCVGRIESVSASEIRVTLYSETPQATALNTGVPTGFPRINAYLVIPNEGGAVVAVVKEIFIVRQPPGKGAHQDDNFIDLPFASRTVLAIPFGTLTRESDAIDGHPAYTLERGVPVLPSVGDPVLLPTPVQLRSIVEAKTDDRLIHVGTAPFAGNARVWVHPDKLFGRHLAVLGNTGSGKSCSVAGLVRWSLEAATDLVRKREGQPPPNARFIILDPNGEYTEAFRDGAIPYRRLAVGGADGADPLVMPGWLWNGQEWAAVTSAQSGVQRPLLLKALRLLRNAGATAATAQSQVVRRYMGYARQVEQLYADVPQSVSGFVAAKSFGELLEGLVGLTTNDEKNLTQYGAQTAALVAAVQIMRPRIDSVRTGRYWQNQNSGKSGYNNFQPNDLTEVLNALHAVTEAFDPDTGQGEFSEDAPLKFNLAQLAQRIHDVAQATGGQALANVEPLVNRIQVMLGDPRLRPVIESDDVNSLTDWLETYLGPNANAAEPLVVVDLSLVPSDVIHITVAVICRLIFEALQRHLKELDSALPTVLVLEEAHSFVRRDSDQGVLAPAADLCRQTIERIAREGRKFGLGMVLASQRPSELSPTVLAQCNSFLLHRIVNDVDQNLVRRLVPDALGGLLGELPTLPSQQAILLGWAVPTPVLVRVRDLARLPRSADPQFWKTWGCDIGVAPDWDRVAKVWEGKNSGS